MAPERLYFASTRRLPGHEALAPWWADVSARAAQCDLKAAWEVLRESSEGPPRQVTPEALAELAPGGDAPEDVAAAVAAIFGEGLRFKLRDGRVHVTSAEGVAAAERAAEEERRAKWGLTQALGVLRARLAGQPAPPSDDPAATRVAVGRHLTALADVAVTGRESSYLPLAQQVLDGLAIESAAAGEVEHRAFAALVALGEFAPHENLSLKRGEVRRRFGAAVLAEAEALAAQPPRRAGAVDRTGLLTVAIDDPTTTEVDDAFAVDGDRLCVFIADVPALVALGSRVDEEAAKRVSTLYLPEGKLPMLPPLLGEGALSLRQGEPKAALCLSGVVAEDGELTDFRLEHALCRVDRQLTYDEVDAAFAGGAPPATDPDPVRALLGRVAGWMDRHQARRERAGAMTFQRQEVYLDVDAEARVTFQRSNPNGPGRQLIAELMVSVCAATARLCEREGIPCVYRSQPAPDKLPELPRGPITDVVAQAALLRKFKPTVLTTRPNAHFSLGVDVYTQVTSPIRRYQDLLMHHQLAGWLTDGAAPLSEADLLARFDHLDRRAGAHRVVEQESRRYWTLWYLQGRPDLVLDGVVLRPAGRRWVVRIPDYALQVTLSARGKLSPGKAVRLRIDEVDARRDVLVVSEVPPGSA